MTEEIGIDPYAIMMLSRMDKESIDLQKREEDRLEIEKKKLAALEKIAEILDKKL